MNRIRERLFWPLIVLVVLGCGVFMWRRLHPSLTPQEQVTAQTNALAQAIEARNARSVSNLLAKDFMWEGQAGGSKKDIMPQIEGAFFLWHEVKMELSGVQVAVKDETASSHGNYQATFRGSADAQPETHSGSFDLEWALRDGQWKVVKARGEGMAGLGRDSG